MARGGGAAGSNGGAPSGASAAAGRGLLQEQEPAAAGAVAAAAGPPRVPLVAVVCFGRRPHDGPEGNVYAAQQLIRHAEYHLEQIGMQRMLVYCSMVRAQWWGRGRGLAVRRLSLQVSDGPLRCVRGAVWNDWHGVANSWCRFTLAS